MKETSLLNLTVTKHMRYREDQLCMSNHYLVGERGGLLGTHDVPWPTNHVRELGEDYQNIIELDVRVRSIYKTKDKEERKRNLGRNNMKTLHVSALDRETTS